MTCYGHRMDDEDDAALAIESAVQALKLAGVDEHAIASQLMARSIKLKMKLGIDCEGILDDVEDDLAAFVKHFSKKS